ncbi:unnamed protein product [Fusarium fujikuroi]|nr:unnamed protein product [Fusarium fujikuroi]
MHVVSLIVMLQSIRLCVARPVDLQSSVLTTDADEILTPQDVVSGFKDWFKPKPTAKVKNTKDSICGDGSETCDQCANKPNPPLDMGKVSDSGKLDQKVNGTVLKDTEGNEKFNGKPKAGSNEESSHKSNDTKKSLEWHDISCFGQHQFGKHRDIYRISQQNYAGFACPETESKMIKMDDNTDSIKKTDMIRTKLLRPCVRWSLASKLPTTSRLSYSKDSPLSPLRVFPSNGFKKIDSSVFVEEERLPFYRREDYYPVCIGQVIHETYQVVAKLGYGTSSTLWLSRDLRDERFWVLKVHINTLKHNQELAVYEHLSRLDLVHAGRQHVREVRDTFKLSGPNGEHEVFVMPPLGMSLRTLQELQQDNVFQQALDPAESADIHSDNLLVALTDDSILPTVEDNELQRPSARKFVDKTVIHVSQYMLGGAGALTICDLGHARIGKVHRGNAMPLPYRAPEVILGMTWGNSVDVWSVGLLAWELLHKKGIFRVYDESGELNDAHHLAAMTALLGPPPDVFLRRSDKTRKYWDTDGKWHGPVPLPEGGLKSLKTNLSGEDRDQFLGFLTGTLTWLPEDRLNSAEAYFHPWLRGKGGVEE